MTAPFTAKAWRDQPHMVTAGEPVLRVHVASRSIEVRHYESSDRCTVTIGNLFGSRTVLCDRPLTALRVIDQLGRGDLFKLPEGCTVLDNAIGDEVVP